MSSAQPKRKPIRKLQRPTIAPALDDACRPALLPSAPSAARIARSSEGLASRLEVDRKVFGYTVTSGVGPPEKQLRGQAQRHDAPLFEKRLSEAAVKADRRKGTKEAVRGDDMLTPGNGEDLTCCSFVC